MDQITVKRKYTEWGDTNMPGLSASGQRHTFVFPRWCFSINSETNCDCALNQSPQNRNLTCAFKILGLSFLIIHPSLLVGETLHRQKTMLTADTSDNNSPWQNKWQWGEDVASGRRVHVAKWGGTWWSRIWPVSKLKLIFQSQIKTKKGMSSYNYYNSFYTSQNCRKIRWNQQ